jgi:hypothetical protein
MGKDPSARQQRPVLIHTLRGTVEGSLEVNPNVRTLDVLNLPHRFVTIDASEIELSDDVFTSDRRAEAAHFTREGISLRVADCDVKGYIHVRGVHDPLIWLNQSRQPFMALTSASVVGPDFELAASFLAVNPAYILAVQTMDLNEAEPAWAAGARTDRPAVG